MKSLYYLKELNDILLIEYNSIMKIEFSPYDNTMYHIIITNNKMSVKYDLHIEDEIEIDKILRFYKETIIKEVLK